MKNQSNASNEANKTSKRERLMTVVQLRLASIKKRIKRIESAKKLLKKTPIPFDEKQT